MLATLKIVLLSSQYDQASDGKYPICLQFTQNRKVNRIRLGKSILREQWKGIPPEYVKVKSTNSHPNARYLNLFLNNELARAERIILNAEIENRILPYEDFKSIFLNLHEIDFFHWHHQFLEHRKSVGEMQNSTLERYESQRRKLLKFKANIKLGDITENFVRDYQQFLADELHNGHNTRQKSLSYVKSVFEFAKRKGAINGDPFGDINMAPKYGPRTFLFEEEVESLVSLYRSKALKPLFQHVLKKFIWCCYTGQSFSDMIQARYKDILDIEGYHCIQSQRNKTDQPYFVPLLPVPLELITPFPENRDNLLFRTISNQKYNTTLREIVKIVGIKKHVSSHIARHTCGHILVSNGVSRDYVMTILGHSRIDMTKHYSQIMPGDTIRHILGKFENDDN